MDFLVLIACAGIFMMVSVFFFAMLSHERFVPFLDDMKNTIFVLDHEIDRINVMIANTTTFLCDRVGVAAQFFTLPQSIAAIYLFVALYGWTQNPGQYLNTLASALEPCCDAIKTVWTALSDVANKVYSQMTAKTFFEIAIFIVIITAFPDILRSVVIKMGGSVKLT